MSISRCSGANPGASTQNFYVEQLAESVGKIVKNETQMMIVVNNFIDSLKDEDELLYEALKVLNKTYVEKLIHEISSGTDTQKAINTFLNALIKIIQSSQDTNMEDLIEEAINSLDNISPRDKEKNTKLQVITTLTELLKCSQNDYITDKIVTSLGIIGNGNILAINTLIKVLKSSKDLEIVNEVIYNLGEIGKGNDDVITALIDLLTSEHLNNIEQLAESLAKVIQNETQMTRVINSLIGSFKNKNEILNHVFKRFNKAYVEKLVYEIIVAENNQQVTELINALIKLTQSSQDKDLINSIKRFLVDLYDITFASQNILTKNNAFIIRLTTAFIGIIQCLKDDSYIYMIVDGLGKIGHGNTLAINTLIKILKSSKDPDLIDLIVCHLGKIGKGNDDVITALIEILSSDYLNNIEQLAESLGKTIHNDAQMMTVRNSFIESLKDKNKILDKALNRFNEACLESMNFYDDLTEDQLIKQKKIMSLIEIIQFSNDEDSILSAVRSVGEIGQGNEQAITALISFIQSSQNHAYVNVAVKSLGKIGQGNEQAITTLVSVFQFSQWGDISSIGENLMRIIVKDQMPKVVTSLKNTRLEFLEYTSLNNRRKWNQYKYSFSLLWECAQTLSYPEFYKAWHSQSEIIHPEILEIYPSDNTNITQALNQQILDLPSQLQSTEKTYPIVINAQSLEDETDNDSIAQELCNQIYAIAFPNETDIPEINNAPQLKRLIPYIKKQLNTQNLALIFHNGEPNESLNKFCKKLTDVIHIKWITEQPIAYGVPPQENLVNILQNWIDHLG